MALANTQQLAGGQHEFIIQLCFTELCMPLNWVFGLGGLPRRALVGQKPLDLRLAGVPRFLDPILI